MIFERPAAPGNARATISIMKACERVGVSRRTIYKLDRAGKGRIRPHRWWQYSHFRGFALAAARALKFGRA
jgi:hypothetical protein